MLSRQVEQLENRFRDKASGMPSEVWAELRPLVNELGHIREQAAGLESNLCMPPQGSALEDILAGLSETTRRGAVHPDE